MTDGSSCMKLLLWNKEVEQMVGKAAKKIKELSISDDEYLMSIFGSTNSSFNASCSQHVPNTSTTEIVESNCDSSYETPAKRSSPDIGDGSTAEAVMSANVQASANKTFKRNCRKKKLD
ncbi:hypothetical protein AHAS_Ahas11G0171500 [Arachis hypogaea]